MAFSGALLAAIIGAMCLCANSYPYPESVAQDLEDLARRYDDDVDSAQFTEGGAEFAGMGPQDDINPPNPAYQTAQGMALPPENPFPADSPEAQWFSHIVRHVAPHVVRHVRRHHRRWWGK